MYIKKNTLSLGKENEQLTNLNLLVSYIYYSCQLNHQKMLKLYQDLKVPVNYDDEEDYDEDYRWELGFMNCTKKDHMYEYDFDLKFIIDDENEFIKEVREYLQNNETRKLKIAGATELVVYNNHGTYKTSRGVREMDWKLHFWPEFHVKKQNGISFHDMVIALYKVKSHKFEHGYEMYCGVKDLEINDKISFEVEFDHGS